MIVCADDYGLRDDINEAILELAGLRKLSAVSCLVALDRCGSGTMKKLLRHDAALDIGLHLCLTDEGLPLSASRAGPERIDERSADSSVRVFPVTASDSRGQGCPRSVPPFETT